MYKNTRFLNLYDHNNYVPPKKKKNVTPKQHIPMSSNTEQPSSGVGLNDGCSETCRQKLNQMNTDLMREIHNLSSAIVTLQEQVDTLQNYVYSEMRTENETQIQRLFHNYINENETNKPEHPSVAHSTEPQNFDPSQRAILNAMFMTAFWLVWFTWNVDVIKKHVKVLSNPLHYFILFLFTFDNAIQFIKKRSPPEIQRGLAGLNVNYYKLMQFIKVMIGITRFTVVRDNVLGSIGGVQREVAPDEKLYDIQDRTNIPPTFNVTGIELTFEEILNTLTKQNLVDLQDFD